MSKLAVWSSSCFSTLVQVSWPGPCCLVLVFCCFIQSFKFSYQQRGSSTGIQIIHLVIVLYTKRYCFQAVDTQLAPGARNEDGQQGAKSSQDTFLSRSCGKSCGLRTKHKEGRKTAKQLVFSEIEISNLNLGYLSPSESWIISPIVIVNSKPVFQQQLLSISVCGSDLWPRSCYEWCPPH